MAEATVDFTDNFDGSELEPIVLPAKLPMLLLNGATGIAVGMATNCPPHNLGELVDALQLLLGDRAVSDEKLFAVVPAPDFPTGGIVMGTSGAQQMYATGRGSIVIRAAAHVEPASRGGGRESVVVTELPYGVAKNRLLENVAALVNEKKLDGIAEIRDESSMEGVRIVFEIKRDSEPVVVLNNMYKRTPLQNSFAGSTLATHKCQRRKIAPRASCGFPRGATTTRAPLALAHPAGARARYRRSRPTLHPYSQT